MIGVKLEGRLGNQMFQFAFAHSTAKKLKSKFYLDRSTETFLLPHYFTIPSTSLDKIDSRIFKIRGYKNLFSYHLRKLFFTTIKNVYGLKEITFLNENFPKDELKKVTKKTLFRGFFQSDIYFESISQEVRNMFIVQNKFKLAYNNVFEKLPQNKTIIVVHIRRGDYLNMGLNLPITYFHDAIKQLSVQNPYYVFISDEPSFIEQEFSYLEDIYISKNSDVIDFQFLLNADICIISNSSFSWWGAYLNKKKIMVFAPKFWLGKDSELPKTIIPEGWVKI